MSQLQAMSAGSALNGAVYVDAFRTSPQASSERKDVLCPAFKGNLASIFKFEAITAVLKGGFYKWHITTFSRFVKTWEYYHSLHLPPFPPIPFRFQHRGGQIH